MIIYIKIKPNCSFERLEKFSSDRYLIYIKKSLDDSELEEELTLILSRHFGVPPKNIEISCGRTESERVVELSS
jgi:uncharacterized protein YggU (UPF0235/DUF167 family)